MLRARWFIGAAIGLAATVASFAYESEARAAVAINALRLAPPALGRQLLRHREDLVSGAAEHPPEKIAAASRRLKDEIDGTVSLINSHKPFAKISAGFGRIAGILASLNNPLWGETAVERKRDADKFSLYFQERLDRFPLVFNGYNFPLLESRDLDGFVRAIRERYQDDRDVIVRAYHPPDGGLILPADFDDRSVPFAIASLTYSHAVNDTSLVWIHVWRRANGDLRGTPYIDEAPRRKSP